MQALPLDERLRQAFETSRAEWESFAPHLRLVDVIDGVLYVESPGICEVCQRERMAIHHALHAIIRQREPGIRAIAPASTLIHRAQNLFS